MKEPLVPAHTSRQTGGAIAKQEILELKQSRKQENARLKEAQPWYRNSSNTIAIIAILISIGLGIWSVYKRKMLSYTISKPTSLVLFTPRLRPKASITYDQKSVPDIGAITVRLANVGTEPIEAADFKDGPISFYLSTSDTWDPQGVPLLLEVSLKNRAGQRKDELNIGSINNPSTFTYLPSLLNQGEFVEMEIYTSQVDNLNLSLDGKFAGGHLRNEGSIENSTILSAPFGGLRGVLFSVRRMSGSKWRSAMFFAVLSSLFVFLFWNLRDAIGLAFYWYEYIALILSGALVAASFGLVILALAL